MAYVVGKFLARSGIKGYRFLLTGARKIMAYDADKTEEKEVSALKLLDFKSYNKLVLAQEDTF